MSSKEKQEGEQSKEKEEAQQSDGGESGTSGDKAPQPNPRLIASQKLMEQTRAQVDELTQIMKDNAGKRHERDAKISHLDQTIDALTVGTEIFEKQSEALNSAALEKKHLS